MLITYNLRLYGFARLGVFLKVGRRLSLNKLPLNTIILLSYISLVFLVLTHL
jgi:hypothetical protein